MTGAARRRGQPLAVLGVVLAGWVAVRMVLWQPSGVSVIAPDLALARPEAVRVVSSAQAPPIAQSVRAERSLGSLAFVSGTAKHCSSLAAGCGMHEQGGSSWPVAASGSTSLARAAVLAVPDQAPTVRQPREPMLPPTVAAGHQLMILAALGQLPLPPLVAASLDRPAILPQPRSAPGASRWSGDGWVLLRRGSDGLAAAPSFARYGASQAGAVLRYAVAPNSAVRPQAHLRLTRALIGARGQGGESEAAAGLSLRPPGGLPLRLYGEGRVQRVAGQTRLRPAATLVSELPPMALPLGAQADLYAASGYVGGRDATPFFDAQLTADRAVAARGPAELRLGAGAWAGGQEGAARLDLGPRASLRLQIGQAPSRLALDWRFRVAGRAAPASGPALTLSAGF